MVLSRLPTPEPSVFSGDPLKFLEWRTSFKALIERRCTNPADKLFYLQKYVSGEAQSVLEGSFYRKDDEAYDQAWEALNARYGHPFVIQRAFREKLNNWPKIGSRESIKLRQFSDFLTACSNAMPHIKGLQVLNDCEENQKMLQKLPDWLTSRWNRHVTMQLKRLEEYPTFKDFANFVAQEAEIACNPVTSFHALKLSEEKLSREVKRSKANAFITNVKASDKSKMVSKTYSVGGSNSVDSNRSNKVNAMPSGSNPVICRCCGENHSIHKCQTFTSKSVEDKRKFILDNNLCFGCLRKGHNSKECRNKATCSICKKHHPTPLHEDRLSSAAVTVPHTMQAEQNSSSLSCCVDSGDGGSTSMIVPVWISSTSTPERETLVYALLDTQSSNTFVDQEVCYDCSRALAPRQVITGGDEEPYAVRTDLGWSIVGSSPWIAKSTEVTGLCHRVSVKEIPILTPTSVIRALESDFRDTSPKERSISQDDIQFTQLLNEKIHQNSEGHLEMPLPFKTRPQLPENKQLALVRLKRLKGRFEKDPNSKDDYVKFMEGVFKDGDAERAEHHPRQKMSGISSPGGISPKKARED
ncbi:hypothetical protein QQF64_025778 [Cirrhinus molitorella]|uniref:CCHC-type domain-containing protein n=1 Tax=Cirrhinus molitorella TaxID=172907 RepID=A0ABR3NPX8_9TELE